MKIFALADLHLSFGVPNKSMELFGPQWKDFEKKIQNHWLSLVNDEDLVLIPGDISWAMKIQDALIDLEWIDKLPGKKILIKGNHDYWWSTLSKVENALPPSLHAIQNNAFCIDDIAIAGTRLWDSNEYSFEKFIDFIPNPKEKAKPFSKEDTEKLFHKELSRLESSLQKIPSHAKLRIAMTHFPPIGADLASSIVSNLLEKYGIEICVFGHLHNVKKDHLPFGKARGIDYHLVSCDYVDFCPKLISLF